MFSKETKERYQGCYPYFLLSFFVCCFVLGGYGGSRNPPPPAREAIASPGDATLVDFSSHMEPFIGKSANSRASFSWDGTNGVGTMTGTLAAGEDEFVRWRFHHGLMDIHEYAGIEITAQASGLDGFQGWSVSLDEGDEESQSLSHGWKATWAPRAGLTSTFIGFSEFTDFYDHHLTDLDGVPEKMGMEYMTFWARGDGSQHTINLQVKAVVAVRDAPRVVRPVTLVDFSSQMEPFVGKSAASQAEFAWDVTNGVGIMTGTLATGTDEYIRWRFHHERADVHTFDGIEIRAQASGFDDHDHQGWFVSLDEGDESGSLSHGWKAAWAPKAGMSSTFIGFHEFTDFHNHPLADVDGTPAQTGMEYVTFWAKGDGSQHTINLQVETVVARNLPPVFDRMLLDFSSQMEPLFGKSPLSRGSFVWDPTHRQGSMTGTLAAGTDQYLRWRFHHERTDIHTCDGIEITAEADGFDGHHQGWAVSLDEGTATGSLSHGWKATWAPEATMSSTFIGFSEFSDFYDHSLADLDGTPSKRGMEYVTFWAICNGTQHTIGLRVKEVKAVRCRGD